ncbi:TetR/AcrR family transcriptional regulator [Brevibacillus borstelensis]|uniref:TetR/AcrR family transcriptional regulator n=1 Tax=Brevibacillus borstelensis TaxID=45462 RepID=UPI0022AFFFD4|nr:TetR/AcrR family transcriptional regulator [Brevibacillus borstelensis]
MSAAAGLSEMTLFRHFGSKQKVLETAVDRFYYTVEMKRIFDEELVWDLQADLFLVSKTYHQIMDRNRKIVLIALKDGDYLPGFREKANKHPQQLKELLTDYFAAMQKKGLMITTDPEVQAMTFMWMNFGAFVSSLTSGQLITSTSIDDFIKSSVQLFVRALTP